VVQRTLYKEMTEENSTNSHLSVAMTTEETDNTHTTGENSMTSSSVGDVTFYMQCAVIFIGVVGIAGNALILYALVASKQHKKHALIVNQNALDLFSSFFLVITYCVQLSGIHLRLTGAFGYWLCLILLSENLVWWGTNGSMINLAIITIDRYLKVVHAVWSRKYLRPWVIHTGMAFAWFVGIVYNIIFVYYTTAVIQGRCLSYAIFPSDVANMVAIIWYILFFYVIILVIFIFCYGRILVAIRRQASVMASHTSAAGSSTGTGTGSSTGTGQTQSQQIQSNVIKTMIIVSAFYAISWLPYNVYVMLASSLLFPTLIYNAGIFYATTFLAFFYTSANPFIYATKFDPVRKILRKMISCKKTPVQPTSN